MSVVFERPRLTVPVGERDHVLPTFFVNGIRHDGGYDAEALLEALRSEL